MIEWGLALQALFLGYFLALNGGYLVLTLLAIFSLRRYMEARSIEGLPPVYSGFEPPVSVLVPAFNEELTICASVRSLLQLSYPEFEIIVVNDGSRDDTLATLRREFALVPFAEAYRRQLAVEPVRGIYRSTVQPNLRVIDKDNGGKADALNAALNAARYPLVCAVDADSILQRDSLSRVVQPFLEDPATLAAGGTVRIANGCEVSGGFLTKVGLPRSLLALVQIVEYLRAFLFGRLGWSAFNAVLIISGAFGMFRKDAVVEAGGWRTDTVGEDMELVLRLHRVHRLRRRRYRTVYLPDPICWTEAPESLAVLESQRTRWQRGLSESITMNIGLLCHPRGGAPGWLALPYFIVFEWLGPLIEFAGYLFMIAGYLLGIVSTAAFLVFLLLAIGFGILLSVAGLLLEEMSFHLYPRARQFAMLLFAVLVENFGFRQLVTLWRLNGLIRWLARTRGWGEMKRTASWHRL
jgi:cellulose synthase/poly-beta-1,6-N-acetylglucosamine synthase-like glycosyltransferase